MHAFRELFDSGVKTIWKGTKFLVYISLVSMLVLMRDVCTQQIIELLSSEVPERVSLYTVNSPSLGPRFNLSGHVFVNWMLLSTSHQT